MIPEKASSFGERLRRLRELVGLTQEELAFEAGLTPTAVSDLERGKTRRPYPHTVRSLADALGLSEDERATLLASVPGRGSRAAKVTAPASTLGTALPNPTTPLVGRERELREIRGLLLTDSEVRLLTLTGIGGVGKTRLALEAARASLDEGRFADGVAFVSLAPLRDPGLVAPTIARSLGLREEQGQGAADSLRVHLREKQLLLVLDNFEHLLGAAAGVVNLIESCPDLVVLATSRAPLRVRGEQEYPVPPLALPSTTHNPTEEVLRIPSGRLFVERARAASPSFEVTSENAPAVAAICWRVAGLPLALELAAAKVRLLEPAALLSRLDQALSTAWARDLPERQRTMRATLDWSYDLLSEPERELFRRLSTFVGGFTLEAAEAVGPAGSVGVEGVLDLLGLLAEQSLVAGVAGGDEARYGMLEPVRQYARQRLEESGEDEEALLKHTEYFLTLAEKAAPELFGLGQVAWLDRLERESGNLGAAISRSLAVGKPETAARFGWALLTFWWIRGYHREGRRWAEATLEGSLPPALRIESLQVAGSLAYVQGDYPAAEERYREAILLSRGEENPFGEAYAKLGMGLVHMSRSEHEAATSEMEGALALFERCAEDFLVSVSRVWLGTALLARGDSERAERMFEEGLEWARRAEQPSFTYVVLYNLAQLALSRGELEAAASMLGEGIELSRQTKDRANLSHFLRALSAVEAFRTHAHRSAVLIGAAEGSLREVGALVYNFYRPDLSLQERAMVEACAVLGKAAFEEARERGREMNFEQAVEYALESDEPSPTQERAG